MTGQAGIHFYVGKLMPVTAYTVNIHVFALKLAI